MSAGPTSATTRNFTCTYHGWAYDLEGKLVSVPNKEGYPDSFRTEDWGLVEVPHVRELPRADLRHLGPRPGAAAESLGDMAWYLDAMLDHDEEGTVVVGGVHKWVLEGNWKLAAEQFATDWYHVNMSHASALMVLSPDGQSPRTRSCTAPAASTSTRRVTGRLPGAPQEPVRRADRARVDGLCRSAGTPG